MVVNNWGCRKGRTACVRKIEGYSKLHGGGSKSDHAKGKAIDAMLAPMGTRPTAANKAVGDKVANYFVANAKGLRVSDVIWNGRIWSARNGVYAWRSYTNPFGSTLTHKHVDHVYISFTY